MAKASSSSSWRNDCKKKCLICVEQLLETDISQPQLIQAAAILSRNQFDDVIDERNIIGLCGYPLCQQKLGRVPTQRYRIIVERKQILDITERKKYCSDICFKCSQYYSSQLSPEPLWTRSSQQQNKKAIQLLSHEKESNIEGGGHGNQSKTMDCGKDTSTGFDERTAVTTPTSEKYMPTGEEATPTSEEATPTSEEGTPIGIVSTEDRGSEAKLKVEKSKKLSSFDKLSGALVTWTTHCVTASTAVGGCGLEEREHVFLPAVHSVTGRQLQWSIFSKQLNSALEKVCSSLKVNLAHAQEIITDYTSQFNLDRHSITFRPSQWRIIILLLLIRCDIVSESVLMSDHTISSIVPGWLSAADITEEQLQTLLTLLRKDNS